MYMYVYVQILTQPNHTRTHKTMHKKTGYAGAAPPARGGRERAGRGTSSQSNNFYFPGYVLSPIPVPVAFWTLSYNYEQPPTHIPTYLTPTPPPNTPSNTPSNTGELHRPDARGGAGPQGDRGAAPAPGRGHRLHAERQAVSI